MPQIPNCRECGDPIPDRVGRGLCRPCWDNPKIRLKYPCVAPFGGREASRMGNDANERRKLQAREGEGCRPLPPGPERTYAEIQTLRRRSHQVNNYIPPATEGDDE